MLRDQLGVVKLGRGFSRERMQVFYKLLIALPIIAILAALTWLHGWMGLVWGLVGLVIVGGGLYALSRQMSDKDEKKGGEL